MDLLTTPTIEEQSLTGNFRLACRSRISGKPGTICCHTLRREQIRIEDTVQNLPTSFASVPLCPAVTLDGTRIYLDGELISHGEAIYGVALDVGTTTVVARLIDLSCGELVASSAFENPQRFAGSNVMSRIHYDMHNKGRLLQRTLCGYLTHAIEEFDINPENIYEVVVAGNTTMRDLFFGLNTTTIGSKPFQSITEMELMAGKKINTSLTTTAKKIQLPIHPRARIYGLPLISSHIGADAAACLLAIDLSSQREPVLLMDIGTNIELVCSVDNRILVTSCPAGPAFEGGAINNGMPAMRGAIERFEISANGQYSYQTIDHAEVEGICGSGLIDMLSELSRVDMISTLGRSTDGRDRFEIESESKVALFESDIAELAQAKGAACAGIRILLEKAGLKSTDLHRLYLAGGFAKHLDLNAARNINLIPDLPNENICQIGNASLEGATIALCSVPHRRKLEVMVSGAEHVALEQHPSFFDYFVDGCLFGNKSGSLAAGL
jgi:uncharacterized 2Fe-2S/4Fe-4S cluster protein (DUF4445 family)